MRGQIITIFVILRGGFSILHYCLRQNYHYCSRILTRAGLPTSAFLLFTGAESASGMQFDIGTAATSQLTSKLEMEIICWADSFILQITSPLGRSGKRRVEKRGSHYLSTSTQREEWKWQISILFWHTIFKNSLIISFFFHLFLLVGGQLLYNIVVGLVIHWHESAIDLHVFPIPIPPPASLSTHPSGSSQCTRPEHLSHASNLGWWSVSL